MPIPLTPRRRRQADQYQLSFPLAWLADRDLIEALRQRGVRRVRRVLFKPNRSRLITLSADHRTLHLHESFRGAPDDVLDAVAGFLRLPEGSSAQQRAVERMRDWCEAQIECEAAQENAVRHAGSPAQIEFLREAYATINQERFGGRLPAQVPLRLSDRMSKRFGHVSYGRERSPRMAVEEIALNIDLFIEGNEPILLDTLVHEMAHIEAWIEHGHRGHGLPWRVVAQRAGCEVNATSRIRFRRRRRGEGPVLRVPDLQSVLRAGPLVRRSRRIAS
ncbi:MAG: SprT-like domain-containing protein [Gemmatimonadetes bacterium]|nr:SprT-like domain-containing protein [Gemmatimonadota bacterium]